MNKLILGVKITIALIALRKPPYFNSRLISLTKLRIGYAILFQFVEEIELISGFNLRQRDRKEIIFCIVWMISLIDKAFDKGILSVENFRKFIMEKNKIEDPLTTELSGLMVHIENLTKANIYYNEFLENIIKTWETHSIRDFIPGQNKVTSEEALRTAQNRGRYYFLALTYILSPINLSPNLKKAIGLSGEWFQIIDDYRDRVSDINIKNTLFTTTDEDPLIILRKYTRKYTEEIQSPLNNFMQSLTNLTLLIDWIPLNWK